MRLCAFTLVRPCTCFVCVHHGWDVFVNDRTEPTTTYNTARWLSRASLPAKSFCAPCPQLSVLWMESSKLLFTSGIDGSVYAWDAVTMEESFALDAEAASTHRTYLKPAFPSTSSGSGSSAVIPGAAPRLARSGPRSVWPSTLPVSPRPPRSDGLYSNAHASVVASSPFPTVCSRE